MTEELRITVDGADSFRAPLASEWGLGEVEAASLIRQGHSPSMGAAMLGVGLFKLLAPKRAKELPRKFVLAVAGSRVVAYKVSWHSRGEGASATVHATIHPGELASWPRGDVSMRAEEGGMNQNATLTLGGNEVPCCVPAGEAEPAFQELIAKLGA